MLRWLWEEMYPTERGLGHRMKKLVRGKLMTTIRAQGLMATGGGPGTKSWLRRDVAQDPRDQRTSDRTCHYAEIPEKERYEWLKGV